ncbi:hypothetical protein ABPG74_014878 [Tetrahymena malaccensis]
MIFDQKLNNQSTKPPIQFIQNKSTIQKSFLQNGGPLINQSKFKSKLLVQNQSNKVNQMVGLVYLFKYQRVCLIYNKYLAQNILFVWFIDQLIRYCFSKFCFHHNQIKIQCLLDLEQKIKDLLTANDHFTRELIIIKSVPFLKYKYINLVCN